MEQQDIALAEKLADATLTFLVPMRVAEGWDNESYQAVEQVLLECVDTWKDSEAVPKLAAEMFIALVFDLDTMAQLYDRSDPEAAGACGMQWCIFRI